MAIQRRRTRRHKQQEGAQTSWRFVCRLPFNQVCCYVVDTRNRVRWAVSYSTQYSCVWPETEAAQKSSTNESYGFAPAVALTCTQFTSRLQGRAHERHPDITVTATPRLTAVKEAERARASQRWWDAACVRMRGRATTPTARANAANNRNLAFIVLALAEVSRQGMRAREERVRAVCRGGSAGEHQLGFSLGFVGKKSGTLVFLLQHGVPMGSAALR